MFYRIREKKGLFVLVCLIFITTTMITSGCTEDPFDEPDEITILLDWTPNTNYSGLYAAIEQGYYEDQGLEVETIQASGNVVPWFLPARLNLE